MRIQSILLMMLAATAFAGCLSDEAGNDSGASGGLAQSAAMTLPGMYQSHPTFGYLTPGQLPMSTDGETRVVNDDGTISWFRPTGETWSGRVPAGIEAVAGVATTQGHGIAVVGPLAIYGGDGQTAPPLIVVDISDPMNPVEVGRNDEAPVRDADSIIYPDGRIIIITTGGGSVQYATEVTDPANPVLLSQTETAHGNHNIAVVPGTPIVYNTGSAGVIDILDYTDPSSPVVLGTFENGNGCHDITFYIGVAEEKYRAYCAASSGGRTQIWDIADPAAPAMVYNGAYPGIEQGLPLIGDGMTDDSGQAAPLSIDHLAMVNHDASILILGDETGGGGANGCDFYYVDPVTGESHSGPYGNLWFYDLTDETNPVLLSHVSPEAYDGLIEYDGDMAGQAGTAGGNCTSHFGRLVEDTGFLVMGFYSSGVLLIDFTDPSNPLIVDRMVQGGSVWDVWYQDGYLYTGDMTRGLDILKLV